MSTAAAGRLSGAAGDLAMTARVGGSLIAVLILVVLVARLARRASHRGPGAGLALLERTGLGKDAAVAVVTVAGRALVVGITPHTVTMLAELAPDEVSARIDRHGPQPPDEPPAAAGLPRQASGSVLSPATWKQGVEALRDRTSRK